MLSGRGNRVGEDLNIRGKQFYSAIGINAQTNTQILIIIGQQIFNESFLCVSEINVNCDCTRMYYGFTNVLVKNGIMWSGSNYSRNNNETNERCQIDEKKPSNENLRFYCSLYFFLFGPVVLMHAICMGIVERSYRLICLHLHRFYKVPCSSCPLLNARAKPCLWL